MLAKRRSRTQETEHIIQHFLTTYLSLSNSGDIKGDRDFVLEESPYMWEDRGENPSKTK